MNFNYITNIQTCYVDVPALLYYSHLPAIIISLFFGMFVYVKNKKLLQAKLLFLIAICFSLWASLDILAWATWTSYDSRIIMFMWSLMNLLEPLIFALFLYFTVVFIAKKDISFKLKLFIFLILLPVFFLMPTEKNLINFDVESCEAIQGSLIYYVYFLDLFFSLWIIVFLTKSFLIARREARRQIFYLSIGVVSFLLAFSWANIVGNLTINYDITQYGLFGMPIFMGFLAYLIVKYNAFNIKLIATQALIFALIILIASQFSFIRNNTNKILTAITLVIAVVFGWILVRSVKKEVKQKEELEIANAEISERKEQLQRISDSLAISNEKLKQLDSAKTEFISMASHQLRTPVTGIKGYTSMLIEGGYGEVTPEQKGALKKAFESNERMSTLIEDLLNVSKIESGKLEYEFSKFKMEQICQEVVDTLFPKAKDHNLYLEYKAPKKALPELVIDGTKVREVISNLVDNAVKYTPKGGVTLSLELCAKNEANCLSAPHIRITVSDTGIGVPPEEMEYLFLKFSRGKDVHRLNATGTGLGLFVGKKMIEGNGGKIWIESEGKDKGSRFIVELPLVREEEGVE